MSRKIFSTQSELDELAGLYRSGNTTYNIAGLFGCSPTAVQKTLKRIGVPLRTTGESTRLSGALSRERNPNWKGGEFKTPYGYVAETLPDGRQIFQHRRIMQDLLGRELRQNEEVHHINENKEDNRPENLQLTTREAHARHHSTARHGWQPRSDKPCIDCGGVIASATYCQRRCARCAKLAKARNDSEQWKRNKVRALAAVLRPLTEPTDAPTGSGAGMGEKS